MDKPEVFKLIDIRDVEEANISLYKLSIHSGVAYSTLRDWMVYGGDVTLKNYLKIYGAYNRLTVGMKWYSLELDEDRQMRVIPYTPNSNWKVSLHNDYMDLSWSDYKFKYAVEWRGEREFLEQFRVPN